MITALTLSELLITKLCHDLSASIGAIYNGVELIELDNDLLSTNDRAFQLITLNARIAVNKIKFFRFIYGLTDNSSKVVSSVLSELVYDYFSDSKVRVDIQSTINTSTKLSVSLYKLISLVIYLTSELMIYGGNITLKLKQADSSLIATIEGVSPKEIKINEDLKTLLVENQILEMKLSNIVIQLIAILIHEFGIAIKVNQTPISITFEITSHII